MAIYGNSVRWVSAVSVLLGDASALHLCGYSCRCDAVLSFTVCFWCRHCLDALCLYLRYPEIIMINCFILLLSLPVLSTFWPPWWLGWFAGYTSARFYKMWKGEVRVQHNTVSVSANLIHKRAWWVVAERQGLEENNASDCLLVPSTYFCSQRISLHYLFI